MGVDATQARLIADNPIWPKLQERLRDLYIRQLIGADVSNMDAIIVAKNKLNVLEDVFSTITNLCYEFSSSSEKSVT